MTSVAVLLQVRSDLKADVRKKVNTLIITDVHGRDIIDTFVRDSIMDAREFAWESQLRFYWDRGLVRFFPYEAGLTYASMHSSMHSLESVWLHKDIVSPRYFKYSHIPHHTCLLLDNLPKRLRLLFCNGR
jgi:hypothetical protein